MTRVRSPAEFKARKHINRAANSAEASFRLGLPPGFNYPVSMWDSPPGYFLPPFMGALMSDCVLAINAVLYGVADPEETPNRKASIIHVALKSTLDRQCE